MQKKKKRFPITLRCPSFKPSPACLPACLAQLYTPPGLNSKHLFQNMFWEQRPQKVLTRPISAFLLSGNQEQEVCSCVELETPPPPPSSIWKGTGLGQGSLCQSQKRRERCFPGCCSLRPHFHMGSAHCQECQAGCRGTPNESRTCIQVLGLEFKS